MLKDESNIFYNVAPITSSYSLQNVFRGSGIREQITPSLKYKIQKTKASKEQLVNKSSRSLRRIDLEVSSSYKKFFISFESGRKL